LQPAENKREAPSIEEPTTVVSFIGENGLSPYEMRISARKKDGPSRRTGHMEFIQGATF
jgi:hypothetical protein